MPSTINFDFLKHLFEISASLIIEKKGFENLVSQHLM